MEKIEKPEGMQSNGDPYRKIITITVGHALVEAEYQSVDADCLETLTEIAVSLLKEAGGSSRSYCELAGRNIPNFSDVLIALVNMGIRLSGIDTFARRNDRKIITLPPSMTPQKPLNLLQAGSKIPHPPHIPGHLPPLPDPHAYIRTPTYKQPVTEYEAIRERATTQKRDTEKALTKFQCRTSATHSLFDTEDNLFPLLACKQTFPPYLNALNPSDQVFDFEELEYHYLVANRTEDVTSKDETENDSANEEDGEGGEAKCERSSDKEAKRENEIKPNSTTNKAILENPNIDNPYLRAATLPKRLNHQKKHL